MHPQAARRFLAVEQTAQALVAAVALKAKAVEFAPGAAEACFDAAFDTGHEALEQGKQGLISEAAATVKRKRPQLVVLKD
jgi:hypothetical protein